MVVSLGCLGPLQLQKGWEERSSRLLRAADLVGLVALPVHQPNRHPAFTDSSGRSISNMWQVNSNTMLQLDAFLSV